LEQWAVQNLAGQLCNDLLWSAIIWK
jgi:hypothetical protein